MSQTDAAADDRRRIVNTWDQIMAAGGTGVFISAVSVTTSRAAKTPATDWVVIRLVDGREVATDRQAAWYHNKHKAFSFSCHGDKVKALAAAKAWVANQGWYDGNWVRNRMGDFLPAEINKQFPIEKDRASPRG